MTKKEAFKQAESDYVTAKAATIAIYKEVLALQAVYARARDVETRARDSFYAFSKAFRKADEFKIMEQYIELLAKTGLSDGES